MQSFSLYNQRKKCDGWLITITWIVLFAVIGLTGVWWWQNHKAQQEEITTIAAKSSVSLIDTIGNVAQNESLNTENTLADRQWISTKNTAPVVEPSYPTILDNISTTQTTAPNNVVNSPYQTNIDIASTIVENASGIHPLIINQENSTMPVDRNALIMNFTADCWLELTDTTGKKLFRGLRHKNDTLNLTGQTPYTLKIGAPAAVQIKFQGKSIDLSRFIRTNQVAHLTIDVAQSAVRQPGG